MKIEVSMTQEEDKFSVSSWWARDAEFVLFTLNAQLKAASAMWPELAVWRLSKPADEPPPVPASPQDTKND